MGGVKWDVTRGAHNSPNGERLTERMAKLTGRTPGGCSQETYGPNGVYERAKAWTSKLRRAGAKELAFRKGQEILAEAIGDDHPPVTKACLAEVSRPDVEEDVGRINLVADDHWTKDELEEYLRLVDRAILAYHTIRFKVVARIRGME